MRVVFLGTPEIAVPPLRMLLDRSFEICGVFTQPDRPAGRGQRPQPSAVKEFALERGLSLFQPERARDEENRAIFSALRPDFIVVAAYGQILPDWMLEAPRLAAVNIHFSLLPRYRGAAPVAWAILNGDTTTGVTTMVIQQTLDSGPILMQQEISIPLTMTSGELAMTLSNIGADLIVKTLEGLQNNSIVPIPQDQNQVSWAPRITKSDAWISWDRPALSIHNQIRAMNPSPVACSIFRGQRLNIWRSFPHNQPDAPHCTPGTIVGLSAAGVRVQCGEGTVLELLEVQMPGKKRISGREFANGMRLKPGERPFDLNRGGLLTHS